METEQLPPPPPKRAQAGDEPLPPPPKKSFPTAQSSSTTPPGAVSGPSAQANGSVPSAEQQGNFDAAGDQLADTENLEPPPFEEADRQAYLRSLQGEPEAVAPARVRNAMLDRRAASRAVGAEYTVPSNTQGVFTRNAQLPVGTDDERDQVIRADYVHSLGMRNELGGLRGTIERLNAGADSGLDRFAKFQFDAIEHADTKLQGRADRVYALIDQGVPQEQLQSEVADIRSAESYLQERRKWLVQNLPKSETQRIIEQRRKEAIENEKNRGVLGTLRAGERAVALGLGENMMSSAAGLARVAANLTGTSEGYSWEDKISDWAEATTRKDEAYLPPEWNEPLSRVVDIPQEDGTIKSVQKFNIMPTLLRGAGGMGGLVIGAGVGGKIGSKLGQLVGEGMANTGVIPQLATEGFQILAQGAGAQGGRTAGMFFPEFDGQVRRAVDAGVDEGVAERAAIPYALASAIIEEFNPQAYIKVPGLKQQLQSGFVQAIKDGVPANAKTLISHVASKAGNEGLKEALETATQKGVEIATNRVTNAISGSEMQADVSARDFINEVGAAFVLGGAFGGVHHTGDGQRMRASTAEAIRFAAENPAQVEQMIADQVPKADQDLFRERLDRLSKSYKANGLSEMPTRKGATIAETIEKKNEIERDIKEAPMDPVVEAAKGDPRKRRVAEITKDLLKQFEITGDERKAALVDAGVNDAPADTKAETAHDGSVTLEKKPEAGEKKKPKAAATESREQAGAVTPEAATEPTTNEERTTNEATNAQTTENTGTAPGVPVPEPAARFEPVLTQDVPDDPVSLAAAYEQERMAHGDEGDPDQVLSALTAGDVSIDSYNKFGDRNNVAEGIGKQYLRKNGRGIDVIAQEASEITGQEITPDDVVTFMERFPSGRPMRSPRMAELDQRHGALHGKKLNKLSAKAILAKHKGEVPKFTPNEQFIADEAQAQGVDLSELDDQDSDAYDNMTDEEDDIMFGGGPTVPKFDQNAPRRTQPQEPGGTPPAQGEVHGNEGAGAPDAEGDRLTADAGRARAERDKFVADWNDRGQGLFAPEEGMAQQTIDGGFNNSQENFDAKVEPLNEKVRQADKALADYVSSAASREQAASQQTSIEDRGRFEKKAEGIARSMEALKLDPANLYALPIPPAIWNRAVSAAQAAVRVSGKFADGVAAAIDHIKNDPWFKSLSKDDQKEMAEGVSDMLDMMTPPLDGPAAKMQRSFDKQRADMKAARGKFWSKAREKFARGVVDRRAILRETLTQAGAAEAMWRKDLVVGASPAAKRKFTKFSDAIFKNLSPRGEDVLNDWIQARRIIDIDTKKDADSVARPLHPGGVTSEMAKVWLAERTKESPKMAADMQRRSDAYFDAQRELLEMKYNEGRITEALYDKLKDNNYSPRLFMQHVLDAEGVDRPQGGNRVSSNDIKMLDKGFMESLMHNARWLLEANTLSTYRTAFENKANRALYEFAKGDPKNGFVNVQKPDGFNNATGQPTYPEAPLGHKQVQYFEKGIRKSMMMENSMATDWENKDPLMGRQVANAFRIATGGAVLRMMATGINPAFALANTPRDIAHVLVTTDLYSPHLPVGFAQINKDIAKVMGDVVKRKGRYLEYLEEGGGMDFLSHQGRPLQRSATGHTKVGEALEATQHFMGWLGETSELLVRVAIRERALEKNVAKFKATSGRDPNAAELKALKENATYQARRQMDFSQGGEWAKAADNFKPYLNATIQGTRTLVRGAKENPKTFSYKIAQLGALATALVLYNLRYSQDDWDDVPDYVKANNFVILLPMQKEDRNGDMRRAFISIPKSQDQVIFAGAFEQFAEFLKTGKYPTKRITNDLKNTLPNLDPREIPIIAALNSYASNFDNFREQEIWKGKDNLEPWAEFTANTPGLYRTIGEITAGDDKEGGVSPERLRVASSKLLTDQENNVFTQVFAKGYGLAAEGLGVKERKELDKAMLEHLNDVAEPMYRRWLRFTDPKDDAPDLDRYDRAESTRRKLQDDEIKGFMSRLRKADGDKAKETAVNKDAQEWVNSEPPPERKALAKKYLDWRENMDVDFDLIRIKNMETPEAKARAMWELWVPASETERKQMEKDANKVGGIISDRFRSEFGKLKKATEDAKPPS